MRLLVKLWNTLSIAIAFVISMGVLSISALAEELPRYNMFKGVTPISHEIYNLHMTVFWICVGIGAIVFGVLITSLILHRKSRGVKPATFKEHHTLEMLWAIIPLVILIVMAIPATLVLKRMDDNSESDITIKVTGHQWKWQYDYLDQGISFFSALSTPREEITGEKPKNKWYLLQVDHPLVVPIKEKIRFLVTSSDVLHSWWVPAFGIKRDAIPGFIHEAWARIEKTGVYRGQCAELCGVNHGYMPIVVVAKTKEDFNQWVADQKQQAAKQAEGVKEKMTYEQLMKLGKTVYGKYCSACHQDNGEGIAPIYPALKASSIAVGEPKIRHIDMVLNGIPGTAMQAFGPQLTDAELAAVITYERNAWGNKTGDLIQPTDIQTAHEQLKKQKTKKSLTENN